MEDYQKRVLREKAALDDKIYDLCAFMQGEVYTTLPPIEQGLLMVQIVAMENYSETLLRRTGIFDL